MRRVTEQSMSIIDGGSLTEERAMVQKGRWAHSISTALVISRDRRLDRQLFKQNANAPRSNGPHYVAGTQPNHYPHTATAPAATSQRSYQRAIPIDPIIPPFIHSKFAQSKFPSCSTHVLLTLSFFLSRALLSVSAAEHAPKWRRRQQQRKRSKNAALLFH